MEISFKVFDLIYFLNCIEEKIKNETTSTKNKNSIRVVFIDGEK
jgi:hypothetical protein